MTPWLIVRGSYDASSFTAAELDAANAFRLEKRREEWLLSRFAAKKLAVQLGIVDDPRLCSVARPMLLVEGTPVNWFVSVSHSAPYAAAIIAREPVGIDVQVVRPIAETAAHLFLDDDEAAAMQRCALADRMLHFWCAKEAAWKRRSDEFATLRQLPLELLEERPTGLRFDAAETMVMGEVIVAVTV